MRRRVFLKPSDVALLDLLHEGSAFEEVATQIGGKLSRDDKKLVVRDFGKRNRATGRNQVRPPLKNEAGVPDDEQSKDGSSERESPSRRAEEAAETLEKERQTKNENRCNRDKKTVAEGRYAGPIRIAGDQVKESGRARRKVRREDFRPSRNENKADDRQRQNGSPDQNAVLGRNEDGMPVRRSPVPCRMLVGAEAKESTENNVARDERGYKTENHGEQVAEVCCEERSRFTKFLRFQGIPIVPKRFDQREDKKNAIGEINVEHQPGNEAQQNPLAKRPRTTRALPVPEKKSHSKDGMRVGPGRIEIHVNGKRAGAPDSQRGEEGPTLFNVLTRERIGKQQA